MLVLAREASLTLFCHIQLSPISFYLGFGEHRRNSAGEPHWKRCSIVSENASGVREKHTRQLLTALEKASDDFPRSSSCAASIQQCLHRRKILQRPPPCVVCKTVSEWHVRRTSVCSMCAAFTHG